MYMEHLLCHSCWNKDEPVRIDTDTVKIFRPNQMRAVLVHALQHRCHGAEKLHKMLSRHQMTILGWDPINES